MASFKELKNIIMGCCNSENEKVEAVNETKIEVGSSDGKLITDKKLSNEREISYIINVKPKIKKKNNTNRDSKSSMDSNDELPISNEHNEADNRKLNESKVILSDSSKYDLSRGKDDKSVTSTSQYDDSFGKQKENSELSNKSFIRSRTEQVSNQSDKSDSKNGPTTVSDDDSSIKPESEPNKEENKPTELEYHSSFAQYEHKNIRVDFVYDGYPTFVLNKKQESVSIENDESEYDSSNVIVKEHIFKRNYVDFDNNSIARTYSEQVFDSEEKIYSDQSSTHSQNIDFSLFQQKYDSSNQLERQYIDYCNQLDNEEIYNQPINSPIIDRDLSLEEQVNEWMSLIERLTSNDKLMSYALAKPRTDFKSVSEVGEYLKACREAKSVIEKAWLVYVWIAHNIAYDLQSYSNYRFCNAQSVLRRGLAISKGYAELYRALCEHLWIK